MEGALPSGVEEGPHELGIKVGLDTADCPFAHTLHLVPRVVTVGVGCKRGTDATALEAFVRGALGNAHVSPAAVARVASIDVKRDEEAVLALARALGCEPVFYSAEQLAAVEVVSPPRTSSGRLSGSTTYASALPLRAARA